MTYEEYIRDSALQKDVIDLFLDPSEPSWAKFHPELGYVLNNYMPRDGLDGCLTISTAQENGSRTSVVYTDMPCRINTYGNSFTQCHQVGDHETWQEYLAAHLGEPIRNFGMGGYGVYQAYRRMLRTEHTEDAAENIVLYIWGDDHYRSLVRCRYAQIYPWFNHHSGRLFHGNFWCNLEMDLDSGEFVEKANLLSTPESVYQMTDPDFMWEALHDDLMLQMTAFVTEGCTDFDQRALDQLAEALNLPSIPNGDSEQRYKAMKQLQDAYALSATKYLIDRCTAFAEEQGKQLLIALFDPGVMQQLINGVERRDAPVVEHLQSRSIRYFDMNLVHVEDYKNFNLSLEDYMKRYFIGHYSPAGNHFFAFAIKNAVVDLLDPKPVTYRDDEQARISFDENYLPD